MAGSIAKYVCNYTETMRHFEKWLVYITIFVAPQSMKDIKNQVLDLVESSDNVG